MNYVALKTTKVDVRRALALLELCPDLEIDEQLKLSTLEGETELCEIMSILLAENEDDEGMIESNKAQIDARRERIARFERRIDARREAIISLMNTAMITKLPLPEATVSLRILGPRPKVSIEEAVPDAFCKFVRKPDMKLIEAALDRGEAIPGVILTNGGTSLTVRRK